MVLPQSPYIQPASAEMFHLSALQSYSTWGELLAGIRNHNNLTQQKIAEASKPYFIKANEPTLKARIYGDMERGRRPPYFQELEPLFRTFVEVYGVEFSDLEITAYAHLAKEQMAKKKKRKEYIEDTKWEALIEALFRINNSKRNQKFRLIRDTPLTVHYTPTEDPESRRLKAIDQALRTDTSHLLERDEWVTKMLAYPENSPQTKLVAVQGHMGTGKSHALALLIQRLAKKSQYYLIPYLFEEGSSKTPEDHLDVFLATIIADLTMTSVSNEVKQKPLEERIDQVLTLLNERGAQGQKVILLLDDAQAIFSKATEWVPAWAQFFETLVREPHTTTLYLMTRTWPGWEDRRLAYVEELDLPELSAEASITIWKRKGFDDVPEDLLHRISHRYGYNPQLIEMSISQCKKRSLTYSWMENGIVIERTQKNQNTRRLEDLLEQDTIFDPHMDIKARLVLQHSLSSRLSHQAVQMLECLALSPLGLPITLLVEEFARAQEALFELVNASAVDLNAAASQRAALVPLVREAQYQSLLSDGRKDSIDQRVTDLYTYWLSTLQDFRDDSEKAGLIAEMVVRYVRQRQSLKAAELFIGYGWLCVLFGHTSRIERIFNEATKSHRGQVGTVEQEVGELLLRHHIAVQTGQKISDQESEQIYQSIYDKVITGNISLQPHMEIDVLHNMMLRNLRLGFFHEASQMFDDILEHIRQFGQATPEVYASYLHNKSRLLVRWSEAEKREGHLDAAYRLLVSGVDTLKECICQWRQCLKNALPLQEHYVHFKLARALNDYAYRQRLLGNLFEAQEAIEESIRLKQACAALPSSLATSLSEYSQVLTIQGRNKQALAYSEEAISIMKRAIESGNIELNSELGMLLIERADIYQQQARLEEAKQLLENAVELIGDKRSRKSFRHKAESQIKEIQIIIETAQHYQLDKRWFARYHDLSSFDDLAWHAHAGPFTDEEQDEWARLYPRREEKEIADRLATLIVQSRKREFIRSQEEHHAPTLYYPLIPLDEVKQRVIGLEQLQKEIDLQESNAVVRALYSEAIDENLTILHQCEGTVLQDSDVVWRGHLNLYGKPETKEMMIALQPFCSMLLRAQQHEQAGQLAQELLRQFRTWGLSPEELAKVPTLVPKLEPTRAKQQKREKQTFSAEVIQRFFQDVFDREYHATEWQVAIAPARDYAYVDIDSRTVFLPPYSYTVDDVRDLLAEEIEVHAYRSMSGQSSPLALLGSGLAKYGATEEGLANLYTQQVSLQMHGKGKSKSWISTLCIGFVCGVLMPQHSFIDLCDFLEKAFLINRLYVGGNKTHEEMLADAKEEAWMRAARICRGIPDLNIAGICSLRDRRYLSGYIDVLRYLEHGNEDRLFVGKIKIEDLDAMEELSILTPYRPRRHLALAPDLLERISQYK